MNVSLMKDFTSFNTAFRGLVPSSRLVTVSRVVQAASNLQNPVDGLPNDYARAYAGVITQQYDSNDEVQDVTPDEPRSTVDFLINKSYAQYTNAVKNLEVLKQQLADMSVNVAINQEWAASQGPNGSETYIILATNDNYALFYNFRAHVLGIGIRPSDPALANNTLGSGKVLTTPNGAVSLTISGVDVTFNSQTHTFVNTDGNLRSINVEWMYASDKKYKLTLKDSDGYYLNNLLTDVSTSYHTYDASTESPTSKTMVLPGTVSTSSVDTILGLPDTTPMATALTNLI
jgi:hypothetical protein